MNIGEAARACGISAKMIRHYESIGLLPRPPRSESGYRRYRESDLRWLRFIHRARAVGFSTAEIRQLLDLWKEPKRPAREVRQLAQQHLDDIEARVAELKRIAATLSHLVARCRGGNRPDCPILDSLAGEAPEEMTS